ncbi:unnamed protein product [marine sediment metagenome]|uniref:2TM domain-containing protein n=1 Tax=marine sediment metagenome TaxID=412755 RepID=X1JAK1_9ZZZZ
MEGVDERDYQRAKKRVEAIRGFWGHFITYLVVNVILFIIDLFTTPGEWWFYWALGGWGIAIILHAISVFVTGKFQGKKWEEAKIKEVLDKEKE